MTKNPIHIILLLGLMLTATARATLTPVDLRCEYAVDPLGVDSETPRLSWKLDGSGASHKQVAYQIMASTDISFPQTYYPVWDSGKVVSAETTQIPFSSHLNSFEQVFWKVRSWDEKGQVSAWSKPATFTMGMLDPNDW